MLDLHDGLKEALVDKVECHIAVECADHAPEVGGVFPTANDGVGVNKQAVVLVHDISGIVEVERELAIEAEDKGEEIDFEHLVQIGNGCDVVGKEQFVIGI